MNASVPVGEPADSRVLPGAEPTRVVLHVGLYKTGTTYLQNRMRHDRRRLGRVGLYLPAARREVIFAALDLLGRQLRGVRDPRVPGAWDRLVTEINASGLPGAIVSEERLSVATPRQARRAVASFGAAQVHVVVTVRDLARVLVSHWQEEVKNGAVWTFPEYADAIRDPRGVGGNPARGFWMHEDVTAVLRSWSAAVPVDRIHVVTVPPPGSPPGLLAERFGSVVGFRPRPPRKELASNENVGAVGTELLRRLNERLGDRLDGVEHERGVRIPLTPALAALPSRRATTIPATHRAWAQTTAARFVEEIRTAGYHVVGDLSDLHPRWPERTAGAPAEGEAAGDIEDGDLLDAALEALAALATRQGQVLAAADRQAGAERTDLAGRGTRAANAMRTLAVHGQRTAADVATGTSLGRRLTAMYLRRRAGR